MNMKSKDCRNLRKCQEKQSEFKAGNTLSSLEVSENNYEKRELKRNERLLGTSFLAMVVPFIFQYFALHMIEIVDAVMVGHFLTSSDLIALSIGFKAERLADLPFVFSVLAERF